MTVMVTVTVTITVTIMVVTMGPIAVEVVTTPMTEAHMAPMSATTTSTTVPAAVPTTTTTAMSADRCVFTAPHGYTAAVPTIAPKNGQPLSLRPI